jgi:hypothetical protein
MVTGEMLEHLDITRRILRVDTQKLRSKLINTLTALFNYSTKQAKASRGEESAAWARLAAYVAQVLDSIAKNYDENEVDQQLKELQELFEKVKAIRDAPAKETEEAKVPGRV